MAKTELKTKETTASVKQFLDKIADKKKRADCVEIIKLMEASTGEKPKMWGPAIVGFGNYHYKYETGREGDWFQTGFSPRKQNLTLYFMMGVNKYPSLLKKLGKFKTGGSCMYVKSLEDIDLPTLKELVEISVKDLNTHVQKRKTELSK